MSDEATRQFTNTTPATQDTDPGEGLTILATAVTAANVAVPDGWYDRYITLTAGADAVWYAFGPAATPAIDKSYAGGATVAAGTKAENAEYLAARSSIDVKLDRNVHKFLHFQADANTPTLSIRASSQARARAR
jgi:hypothetical protein